MNETELCLWYANVQCSHRRRDKGKVGGVNVVFFLSLHYLVDDASKSFLKNKVFALCHMLAGGGLICFVMKVLLFF